MHLGTIFFNREQKGNGAQSSLGEQNRGKWGGGVTPGGGGGMGGNGNIGKWGGNRGGGWGQMYGEIGGLGKMHQEVGIPWLCLACYTLSELSTSVVHFRLVFCDKDAILFSCS